MPVPNVFIAVIRQCLPIYRLPFCVIPLSRKLTGLIDLRRSALRVFLTVKLIAISAAVQNEHTDVEGGETFVGLRFSRS